MYFKKNFLHAMAVLGYLTKLKRGLGLAFGAHFLKCSVFNILISFSRYQTKCVIKFLFRQLMTS